MKSSYALALTVGAAVLACASAAFAGSVSPVGAPAPLLGAGVSGLAVLVAAGGGYVAMRLRGRKRD